jgi:hypothetical protein
MNMLSLTTNSPAAGQTARKRRQFAASLLVGWFAFWLTAVIAPCCELLMANALAGQQSTSSQQYSVQGPASGDYDDAPCPVSLTTAMPVLPALMTAPSCSTSQVVSHASPAIYLPVPYAVETGVNGFSEQSPPPIPIYLRTARLLI